MKKLCFTLCIGLILYSNQTLGSEAGMPQLNPEFWASQVFWLVLVFSILYLMIWKIFLPRITYSIENRKSRIVDDLNEAQKLKEISESKLEEYNEIIEISKKNAKKIIEDTKKKLDLDIQNKKNKFNVEIEKELKSVEKEISDLKKFSISNISQIATETSAEIIKQIVDTDVNNSSVSAIVEDITKRKLEKNI